MTNYLGCLQSTKKCLQQWIQRQIHQLLPAVDNELDLAQNTALGELTEAVNQLLSMLAVKSQELTIQKEIAETAALAKARFLAAASHDLRQPMHALNLYLGALAAYDLPEAAHQVLVNIRYCAQTMDEMFRGLLDISRLDAHALQTEISVFPIATLLEQIKIEFTPQASAKGLELRVARCSMLTETDPSLLERILRNLVSNAVRYTARGKILIGCRRAANGIRLTVYDTGSGIAKDQQQTIFEEFYQIEHSGRDRTQGLGLGLAIVRRLSTLLGLQLSLSSIPNRGSAFSVGLPRARRTEHTKNAFIDPVLQQNSLAGALITVIDDEHLVLDSTKLLLEHWGCTVITANSMRQAIDWIVTCPRKPDAIICDYRLMGDETGIDVINTFRNEFNSDIPALLITGDTGSEHISKILASGLPVMHKPIQATVLKSALHLMLNQDAIKALLVLD